jgi:hypothetical protein
MKKKQAWGQIHKAAYSNSQIFGQHNLVEIASQNNISKTINVQFLIRTNKVSNCSQ